MEDRTSIIRSERQLKRGTESGGVRRERCIGIALLHAVAFSTEGGPLFICMCIFGTSFAGASEDLDPPCVYRYMSCGYMARQACSICQRLRICLPVSADRDTGEELLRPFLGLQLRTQAEIHVFVSGRSQTILRHIYTDEEKTHKDRDDRPPLKPHAASGVYGAQCAYVYLSLYISSVRIYSYRYG